MEEIKAIVGSIDEIKKSISNFATNEKVEALAEQYTKLAQIKQNNERAAAKHKTFGVQASYDAVANVMVKELVKAGKVEANRAGEWMEKANANLNSTDSGQGSSFKPTTIDYEVSKLVDSYGILRRDSRIRPNVQGTINVNKRATRISVGGVTRADGSISKGGSTYTPVSLSTTEVAAITCVEEKLIWDSPADLISEAITDLAEAAADFEDSVLFGGDGTAAYVGFTGLKTATLGTAYTQTQAQGFTVDAALNLRTKVATSVFGTGKYYIHPFGLAALQTQKASTAGSYFFDIQTASFKLGGSDLELSVKVDSATTAGMAPLYYGDLSKAVTVGLGRPYEIRILPELYAADGQVGIRMVYDLGVVLVQNTAMARLGMVA